MIFISDINDLKLDNTIVMVGKFDGMHRGHNALLSKAIEFKKDDLKLVLITFDMNYQRLVTSGELHRARINPAVDYIIECPFTDDIRNMSPDTFVRSILIDKLGAKAVVAGDDFRFGVNRSGDVNTLTELGEKYGFKTEVVPKLMYNGHVISSTYIREMIAKGNIEAANAMLGMPFFMAGKVEEGRHVGVKLGFPTLNFSLPDNKLMPPDGVYATRTVWESRLYDSITNIGVRPTYNLNNRNYAETHIFDFTGNLYGMEVKVKFYKFIRPVMKFSSEQMLSDTIADNIREVREYFRNNPEEHTSGILTDIN